MFITLTGRRREYGKNTLDTDDRSGKFIWNETGRSGNETSDEAKDISDGIDNLTDR